MRALPSSLVLSLGLLSAGCSRPPTDAAGAAKAAFEAARDADAAEYASESLGSAEYALSDLEAEIATQSERFVLFRSYSRAEELAAVARVAAERAAREVPAGREAARAEATEIMDGVRASLEEVKDLLAQSHGRGTRTEINTMKADVLFVESGLEDFEAAMAEEEYKDARAKAKAAWKTLDRVKARLRVNQARKGRPPIQ